MKTWPCQGAAQAVPWPPLQPCSICGRCLRLLRDVQSPVQTSYLQWLDWTGREIRADKRGHIPANLRPVLERLDLDVEAWAENIARYGSLFHRLVGKLSRLRTWAQAKKLAWLHGLRAARLLYSEAT